MRRTPLVRSARLTATRSAARRVSVARDPQYLAWLRGQRSLVSGDYGTPALPVEAAHGPVNGRGSKGSDYEAVPLRRDLHREQHRLGWPAFESKYGFSRAIEAAALRLLYMIDCEHGNAPAGY